MLGAAVEEVAAARFLLGDLAFAALGTGDADEVLLHPLALGVSGAGDESAVTAFSLHEILAALGAVFIERNGRGGFHRLKLARGLAVRVSGARHELAEASALEHHGASAIGTVLFAFGVLRVCGFEVRQVYDVFFGEVARFRIALVVGAAGVEAAELAPLENQRGCAFFALLVG